MRRAEPWLVLSLKRDIGEGVVKTAELMCATARKFWARRRVVNRRPERNFALDGVEEAKKLLMAMALHVAADHGSIEHVHRREQGRRPVPLVIVVVPARPFFIGRPG